MSYQSFCAALVHVAAKVARSSPELLDSCPFLSVSLDAAREGWRGWLSSQVVPACTGPANHRGICSPRPLAAAAREAPRGAPGCVARGPHTNTVWSAGLQPLFPAHRWPPPLPQEQTRAFVESILPRAQQVAPTLPTAKKAAASGAAAGPKPPAATGGIGPKEAAAKEAAARLPKLKRTKRKAAAGTAAGAGGGSPAGGEMSAVLEASREGSSLPVAAAGASVSRNG